MRHLTRVPLLSFPTAAKMGPFQLLRMLRSRLMGGTRVDTTSKAPSNYDNYDVIYMVMMFADTSTLTRWAVVSRRYKEAAEGLLYRELDPAVTRAVQYQIHNQHRQHRPVVHGFPGETAGFFFLFRMLAQPG